MSAKSGWPFAFGVAAIIVVGLVAVSHRAVDAADPASVLGTGHGLDHVIVIVRDLDGAARTYTELLGFTVSPGGDFPGGLHTRTLRFGSNYVELMSVDSSQARPDDELLHLLKEREGGYAFSLGVSSAQRTADSLRARSFEVVGPMGTPLISEGSKEVKKAPWQTVAITKPSLPFEPLFFIQYELREPRSKPVEHRNTAADLRSVWIAVQDLETATRAYEALGLPAGRERRVPQLAANGREIAAGQGVILLLQANGTKGPLGPYVAQHGEGVVGMSIEVRDLQAVRSLLRSSTKQEITPYQGPYGRSLLVPPMFTHGVWIELFQR